MRRIVSIILAAALFCLTLTACGSRQKTDLSGAKTIALRRFNDQVAADPRLEKVILPLRDGLSIIHRIS